MELDVFLTDRPGDFTTSDDSGAVSGLAYAGSFVAGVLLELETMAFEHPAQGWRRVAAGDVAYDRPHGRLFRRGETGWQSLASPSLHKALDSRLAVHGRVVHHGP